MSESQPRSTELSVPLLQSMSELAGLRLSEERATLLLQPAERQLANTRALDGFAAGETEPAHEFRLDLAGGDR